MLPVHERLECDWECLTSDLISAGMAFNGYHCPRFISWFVHRSKSQSHSCFVILSFTQTNSTNKQLHQAGVSIQFSWNFRLNMGICWLWGLCWKSTCLDISTVTFFAQWWSEAPLHFKAGGEILQALPSPLSAHVSCCCPAHFTVSS